MGVQRLMQRRNILHIPLNMDRLKNVPTFTRYQACLLYTSGLDYAARAVQNFTSRGMEISKSTETVRAASTLRSVHDGHITEVHVLVSLNLLLSNVFVGSFLNHLDLPSAALSKKKTETDVATTRFFIMSLFQRDNYQHNNKIPHE